MPRPRAGSKLTLSQLEQMLADRQSQIDELRDQKGELQKQIGALDRQIRKIGGHGSARRGRPGRPGKAGRPAAVVRRRRGKNAKNLADTIQDVLAGGSSKNVGDIADAAQKAGYKTKSPHFRNIVNQALIKDKRFVSTGRGMYKLKK
jgi:hypothetical protein